MAYNNYKVSSNQPYINSSIEYGYFYLNSLGATSPSANANKWYSSIPVITSNNGIATVPDGVSLSISSPGTYKLNIGLNIIATNGSNSANTTSFAFGNTRLFSQDASGFFGGQINSGMYTNPNGYPYIISWNTTAYSSGNSASSGNNINNNYLVYNFNGHSLSISNGNSQFQQSPGICSTQIIFITTGNQSIYLNFLCNQQNLTIANSFFTLQLLSTNII